VIQEFALPAGFGDGSCPAGAALLMRLLRPEIKPTNHLD